MSIITQSSGQARSDQIKNQPTLKGNTRALVGSLFRDLLDTAYAMLPGFSGTSPGLFTTTAFPTSAVLVKVEGSGWSQYRGGVVGDGVTDDSKALQAILQELRDSTTTSTADREIVVMAQPGKAIYINAAVSIYSSHTVLRFKCPVVCGPNGRVRIYGEDDEQPASSKPHLFQDATAGDTFVVLANNSDAQYFTAGDLVTLRGQRDASGNLLEDAKEQKVVSSVTLVSGHERVNFTQPLTGSYAVSYPSPAASTTGGTNYSEITKTTSTTVRVQANRGDVWVAVNDATMGGALNVGDMVRLQDDQTTSDQWHISTTDFVNRECATVMEKDVTGGANRIRLSHALYHTYQPANNPRIVKVDAVKASRICDAHLTWNASGVTNAFEMQNAIDCHIHDCSASGESGHSWQKQAFRVRDSFHCSVTRCAARDPELSSSGNGYGVTLYGATHCTVLNWHGRSLRHSVLLFLGAAGNTIANCIDEDVRISAYDCHGGNSRNNWFVYCRAVGGSSTPSDDPTPTKAAFRIGNPTHPLGDHWNVFEHCGAENFGDGNGGAFFEWMTPSNNNTILEPHVDTCTHGLLRAHQNSKTYTQDTATPPNPLVGAAQEVYANQVGQHLYIFGGYVRDCPILTDIDGNSSAYPSTNTNRVIRDLHIRGVRFIRSGDSLRVNNCQKVFVAQNEFLDHAMPAHTYAVVASGIDDGAGGRGIEITGNNFRGAPRGIKTTNCPAFYATDNDFSFLVDGTYLEDDGGNNGYQLLGSRLKGVNAATGVTAGGTGPSTGFTRRSGRIVRSDAVGSLTLAFTSATTFVLGSSAPSNSQGDLLATVTYTADQPGSTIYLDAYLPDVSCTTADDFTLGIYVDGTCVGIGKARVGTTGAANGVNVRAEANFVSDSSAHTITLRGGPNTTGNDTAIQSHFGAQPALSVTEIW